MLFKVGVIGLGDISFIHREAIESNKSIELVAVCDIDETKKVTVDRNIAFYTDYIEMIETETLDAVHILLPHYLHLEVIKECVKRNIDVLTEKPIVMNAKEIKEVIKISHDTNVHIGVCFQNRYNNTFDKLIEMISTKNYGSVLGIKGLVTWSRPEEYYKVKPWRGRMSQAGGGTMINQSIHTLDLMQLIGGKIKSIKGSIDNMLGYDIEVEDTANAYIHFENGARGIFYSTVGYVNNSTVELQVICEKGQFTIKDNKLTLKDENDEKQIIVQDDKLEGSKFYYGASHKKLINHFYNCLCENKKDYVTVEEAVNAVRMIEMIRESSNQKRTIELEELDDE